MPSTPISIHTAEHYRWGGPHRTESDAWYLLRAPGLHILEERMPPGASETPHTHTASRQFFYVLEGELTMRVEADVHTLAAGQGIEIPPTARHQAINNSPAPVRFLVISHPPSHGDRIEAP